MPTGIRNPCPNCGETSTLELLRYRKARLERIKVERKRKREQREAEERRRKAAAARVSASGGAGGAGGGGAGGGLLVINGSNAGFYSAGDSIVDISGDSLLGGITIGSTVTDATSYKPSINIDDSLDTEEPAEAPEWDEFRADITGRVNGMESCVGCGLFYNPYFDTEIETIEQEIEELKMEIYSPLELLAMEAPDEQATLVESTSEDPR